MVNTSKIISLALCFGFIFLTGACDDQSHLKNKATPGVVSGKISNPAIQIKPKADVKKDEETRQNTLQQKPDSQAENKALVPDQKLDKEMSEHYDAKGKIDPFMPLIQEKPVERIPSPSPAPVVDTGPKRILTPLEKIDLSQIRLVAVILMKKRKIAMVEDAKGKGYEVGIGTYIGKNQGQISEIKSSSIIIKELVKDYKGRLKEYIQEVKLHKNEE